MGAKCATKLSSEVDTKLYLEGMSRAELADAVGIQQAYLSNILTGKQRMSVAMSKRIAGALQMDDRALRRLALETERRCAV